MHKKFRCGLLMQTKDGKIKKLDLENGGGSRLCDWYDTDITLNDVYLLLLNIFKLDTELETSLYDFQLQPLDIHQYKTFFEYIQKNGLNCTSTILYICIHEVSNNDVTRKSTITSKKKSTTTISPIAKEETSNQYRHVDKMKQDIDSDQNYNSLYEYPFINSINSIMKNIDDIMSQNSYDFFLIKLFENMCIIHGYSHLTIITIKQLILQSKQDIQSIKQSDITLHSNCIKNICISCELTVKLMKRQKNKFNHIPIYSMIRQSFIEFYHNLKILHTQWNQLVKDFYKVNETSSSSVQSIEFGTSKSSRSNSQSSFQHNHETNIEKFNKNSPKHVELFQKLLNNARNLLETMNESHLLTYRNIIQSIVVDIESIRSNINMFNSTSINDAKEMLISLRKKYTRTFKPDHFTSPIYQISKLTKQAYNKTLNVMNDLNEYLTNYKVQPVKNQSSTSLSITDSKQLNNTKSIQSLKRKSENLHVDNYDQSDIRSSSSFKIESLSQCTENINKRKFNKSN